MQLTIIPSDDAVLIDGVRKTFDLSIYPSVAGLHAVQWDDAKRFGFKEFDNKSVTNQADVKLNERITTRAQYQDIIDAWYALVPPEPELPPGPDPNAVPSMISDRQFFEAMATQGRITEPEALDAVTTGVMPAQLESFITSFPVEQQFRVRMILSGATAFQRNHPLTDAMQQYFGWTNQEVDDLWRYAYTL